MNNKHINKIISKYTHINNRNKQELLSTFIHYHHELLDKYYYYSNIAYILEEKKYVWRFSHEKYVLQFNNNNQIRINLV